MKRVSLDRFRLAPVLFFVLLPPMAAEAHAQAWLPEKGEATVAIAFQNIFVKDHYLPTVPIDAGQITSSSVMIETSYAATRRLAVEFGVPFVASKYNGPLPHDLPPHNLPIDDGHYHGALQDLRFGLRYNLVSGRLAVTPFVMAVVPSQAYEFYAHSAVGQRLRGLAVGTSVGRLLDPVLSGGFIQARYSYTFVERVLDISQNKSNADVEVGYFINPSFRVFAIGSGQFTHGGLDVTLESVLSPTGEALSLVSATGEVLFGLEFELNHDRIHRGHYLNVGGGAAFSLSDSVDLFGSFVKSVAVRNGHAVNRGITVGISWTVRPKSVAPAIGQGDERASRAGRTLARCAC